MSTLRACVVVFGVLAALGVTGCTDVCDPVVTNQADAPRPSFDAEIDACITQNECIPLCRDLFELDASAIASCRIGYVDAAMAQVKVTVNDPARCESDGDDLYLGWGDDTDDSGDDSSDDGCDDGSCDDGGDDGSTDSGDDGGDSGGDDGGDDGGDRGDDSRVIAPHHAPAANVKSYTLAPKR